MGECEDCDGTGVCGLCEAEDEDCGDCGGTGVCGMCDGTGDDVE